MADSNDGFVIAEKDLELRGPGELLGTRQTGIAGFRVADLVRDAALLPAVRQTADALLASSEALSASRRTLRSLPHGLSERELDVLRLIVAGNSAGAHLAAMMLCRDWNDGGNGAFIKGAVLVTGIYDLAPIRRTPFLAGDLRLTPAQVRKASPALLPRPPAGRMFSVAGGEESAEFLRQNLLIQQAWGRARVPLAEALPGLNHFTVLDALATPGQRLHQLALELLA